MLFIYHPIAHSPFTYLRRPCHDFVCNSGAVRKPVQLLGAVNPYCALLAERAGAKALYLSGSGVATASYGIPDLGVTNLNDVIEDVRRITRVTKLPLLVDIDTGFGGAFNIARTVSYQSSCSYI
jgi:2-methylisocitrate lyase-like PEP mutase family enzyme